MRILLVEDDPRMRALVQRGLAEHGHEVRVASDGPEAVATAPGDFDVVVLDVMLPGFDGVEAVARMRRDGNLVPVLLLTARDTAADVVRGLDAGADDYLTKPFAFSVLLARLRALDRRRPTGHGPTLTVANLVIDTGDHTVSRGDAHIRLTRTEYDLLECLARHAGRVVRRETLLDRLWGEDREIGNNTLDAFVKSLRKKVDAGREPRLIQTVRGVGYALRVEAD